MTRMGSLRAGASRFAHLAGLGRASRRADDEDQDQPTGKKGRRADEDDDDQRCDDAPESGDTGDEDNSGGMKNGQRADDNDQGDGDDDDQDDKPAGKRSKKSKRADEDEDDGDGEPSSKRSSRADDGDEDDDDEDDDKREMSGRGTVPSARRRERSRCAAIFAHPAAAANPELAASLAFETTMTRREAIAVLRGQSGRRNVRSDRSSRNASLGSESRPSGSAQVQSSWDKAFGLTGSKRG